MRGGRVLIAAALLAGAASVFAHVRLKTSGGIPLRWTSPASIGVVISSAGSADIPDDSDEVAVRMAIEAWNELDGTSVFLAEDRTPSQRARSDWDSDSIHLVWFDEANSSGFFPSGTGTVAITPVWFFSNGVISDADVLFNGSEFAFTTRGQAGRFDVQDVAAHELGHLVGFDHSGWLGASMYPYVDPTQILHRSLSSDELHGVREMYASGSFGGIKGLVRRSADGSIVAGAHVVARDGAGRTSGAALSDATGAFAILGLDAGSYTLYATPLEGAVSAANLGSGNTVQTDFASTVHGTVAITPPTTINIGDLVVDPDVSLSLGRSSDVFPLRCVAGTTVSRSMRGSGLSVAATLTASDPTVAINPWLWTGTQVFFDVTVPVGADFGHVDLTITDGSAVSIAPGALEITPRDPSVSSVSPGFADEVGGTALTITGANFRAGSRVVIGANIYEDGVPGGATVVDSSTITLTTTRTSKGVHDIVVVDSTGVEGRGSALLSVVSVPSIASIFPDAGAAAGGTEVVLMGSDFVDGLTVSIDGVAQSRVNVEAPTKISLETDPGIPGGPYLVEVRNPGGGVAAAAFSYAVAPDPAVVSVSPSEGSSAGGETVTVHGQNFTSTTEVEFGTDPDTGTGGVAAVQVTFVDTSTLEVRTPALTAGPKSVLVRETSTSQADILTAGFTSLAPPSGGGGGGCHARTLEAGSGGLSNEGLWLALTALLFLWNARSRATARMH